jgi:hypothetical protein
MASRAASNPPIDDTYALILYDIGLDGCINGVYRGSNSEIYVELLRKKAGAMGIGDGLFDVYINQYIDSFGPHTGEVLVKPHKLGYIFEWYQTPGTLDFRGIGYKMNDQQIAVYYH